MYCVAQLTGPLMISFKVSETSLMKLSNQDGFIPAPYVARHKWVLLQNHHREVRPKELNISDSLTHW